MTSGAYVLSYRLTSAPLWLGIYLFLWWFLLVIFGLFLLHWGYELPCQDKLPEFHSTPILGCIRILWLVSHPFGLGLDKALCGWNSVTPTVKLTLLQTAVRSINDLRIVKTLDEFQSTTYGHGSSTSLSYDTYYDLLINACARYDKTKKDNIGKRRNVYTTNIDETYVDHPTA